jgi:branched-chain amino acid transport system permease protein
VGQRGRPGHPARRLYALFATGLSLIYGVMRLVNLAHGDFSILAAFLALVVVSAAGWNPLLALVVVVPVMALLGYALQWLVLDRLLGRGVLPAILVTFGFSVIIQNGLLEIFSADSRRLNPGGIETASLPLGGGLAVGWFPLLTLMVAILLLGGLQPHRPDRDRPRLPRHLTTVTAAALMGIDTRRLHGSPWRCPSPSWPSRDLPGHARRSPSAAARPAPVRLRGGDHRRPGSLWGTLVGGMILGVAQTVGAKLSPGWGVLSGHLVFFAVLLLRPSGLFAPSRRLDS